MRQLTLVLLCAGMLGCGGAKDQQPRATSAPPPAEVRQGDNRVANQTSHAQAATGQADVNQVGRLPAPKAPSPKARPDTRGK